MPNILQSVCSKIIWIHTEKWYRWYNCAVYVWFLSLQILITNTRCRRTVWWESKKKTHTSAMKIAQSNEINRKSCLCDWLIIWSFLFGRRRRRLIEIHFLFIFISQMNRLHFEFQQFNLFTKQIFFLNNEVSRHIFFYMRSKNDNEWMLIVELRFVHCLSLTQFFFRWAWIEAWTEAWTVFTILGIPITIPRWYMNGVLSNNLIACLFYRSISQICVIIKKCMSNTV